MNNGLVTNGDEPRQEGNNKVKITKTQLKQIIKEELSRVLSEGPGPGPLEEFKRVYKSAAGMASHEGSSPSLDSHIRALRDLFQKIPEGPTKDALQQKLSDDHKEISNEPRHLTQRSRLSVIKPFLNK